MKFKSIIFIALIIFLVNPAVAQIFYNNGAVVSAKPGVIVQVNGAAQNASAGTITIEESSGNVAELIITGNFTNDAVAGGNGVIRVAGNWINNNTFNAGTGSVFLNGGSQLLTGTISTSFNNLFFEGTGNKTMTINQTVTNQLHLSDRELLTEQYTMFVTNSDPNAILRTSGYVSSIGNGSLSRNTASTSMYLFPVGSSLGTFRYRPVEISPVSVQPNTYTVRMANVDATIEGYNRALISNDICTTNPMFYHRINRTSGNSAINLAVFYNETADGSWDGLARWTTTPLWQIVIGSNTSAGIPMDVASVSNWNDFSNSPYILYKENIQVNLGPDVQICQGNSATLDAGTGFGSYFWSTGASTQTISVNNGGTYIVTVTDGICSNTDTITVSVNALPVVDIGPPSIAICSGDLLTLNAGAGYIYEWSTNETTQTIDVTTAGMYSVTVTDGNLCQNSDMINVIVQSAYDATITSGLQYCSNSNSVQMNAVDAGGVWSGNGISSTGLFQPSAAGAGSHTIIYSIPGSCGDADTVSIIVYAAPQINLGQDFIFCSGDSVILDAGSGFVSYQWSPSGNSQTFVIVSGGIYSVTVTDSNVCQDVDSVSVQMLQQQDATIVTAGPFCSNDSPVQFNAQDGGGIWEGQGINSSGMFVPSNVSPGTYLITYEIAGLCGDTSSVLITVHQAPVIDLGQDQTICSGDTFILEAGYGPGYIYEWSTSENTQTIVVDSTGVYSVTVTDVNNCQESDQVTVTVLDQQDATIVIAGGPYCTLSAPVQFIAASGGGVWSGPGINSNGLFDPETAGPGSHVIQYEIQGPCGDEDEVTVIVYESPSLTVISTNETCIGAHDGTAVVVITGGYAPFIVNWNTGESTDTISNLQPGDYIVLVVDQNDCYDTHNFIISGSSEDCFPPHVYVPNIFSPNADGDNDGLFVRGEGIAHFEFSIFNRWGQEIFTTTDMNNGWDGTYNGMKCDPGVFVYYISVTFNNSQLYQNNGTITLVR